MDNEPPLVYSVECWTNEKKEKKKLKFPRMNVYSKEDCGYTRNELGFRNAYMRGNP